MRYFWIEGSVIIPVHVHRELDSIIILGPKRSLDPYVHKDLIFFEALAHYLSLVFDRIDQHDGILY